MNQTLTIGVRVRGLRIWLALVRVACTALSLRVVGPHRTSRWLAAASERLLVVQTRIGGQWRNTSRFRATVSPTHELSLRTVDASMSGVRTGG